MAQNKLASRVEQVADLLREGMMEGRWRGALPGRSRLADQLGCSHGTVEVAIRQLEREGWLIPQGQGRRRRIEIPSDQTRAMRQIKRVRILSYDKPSQGSPAEIALLARLLEAGYAADFATKSLRDLNMNVRQVARFVKASSCDAWIVCSASREILEWFAAQKVPAIALYGRFTGLPIAVACPRKAPAMVRAVRRLVELGHERIVLTTTSERVVPHPALFEQIFLEELRQLGLPAGSYNLAAVEPNSSGLNVSLRELFRITPPTAILVGDGEHVMGVQQFLARRGLRIPEDVSLVSTDSAPEYRWCDLPISHIGWDTAPLIRRVLRWLDRVTQGKKDIRQYLYEGTFVEGGTIGPVKTGDR